MAKKLDAKTQKKLLQQLETGNDQERYEAVLKLGQTGDTSLIGALEKTATLDPNLKIRALAEKAVRVLDILYQRQMEKEWQSALHEEGEDPGIEWQGLASAKVMDETSFRSREQLGEKAEWSYTEAKAREKARQEQEAREKADREAREKADREARARRRRLPLRIFTYFMVTFAVVAVAFLGWYLVFVEAAPSSQGAILKQLSDITTQQEAAVAAYQAQLLMDPVDCAAMQAVMLPELPRWLALRENALYPREQGGAFGQAADNLSRADEGLLADLALLILAVEESQAKLESIRANFGAACQGRDSLPLAEWGDLLATASLTDEVSVLVQSQKLVIQAEAFQVPPDTEAEAVERLRLWSDEQLTIAEFYQAQLAADPLNCDNLTTLSLSDKPRWIEQDQIDPLILGNLSEILNGLNDSDANIRGVALGVGRICQAGGLLPQTEAGPAYAQIVSNSQQALALIQGSRSVLDSLFPPAPTPTPG
jgi:hypothetical protein